MLTEEAKEFLENNRIRKYSINPDGTVDVNGSVSIYTQQVKFPVKFVKVSSYFDCSRTQLTSLEGSPSLISGNFNCSYNHLTSLHDVHKHIKEINGYFYCYDNPITNSVLGLFLINGVKEILLDNYRVQTIINKHIGKGRIGIFDAQQELLDTGLDEYARL